MDGKGLLNKFKANATLILADKIVVNEFKDIPKKWEFFMDSKNEWCGIDLKLGSTDLLFKGKKGDKVDKHVHVFSNELTFVLSGEIELITSDGISILKTGQSFFIPMNKEHIVTFIEDTTLLVIFTPKMNGLEIEFKK
jgi:mannose-6-phosphate isomerase-like protein (cupin superfamily)